ncbi:potassium channel family protein [Nocardioides koreensis]|uniref:Potassium channel family protein n=1 Tax=Nocardioides koreensis TaxID=433651 RepID=A0ABP5KZS4_9ACTN
MRTGETTAGGRQVPAERRHALVSLARSLLVAGGIVVGYFVLPMTRLDGDSLLRLLAGLALIAALLAWQIRQITRSAYPRLRAVETLSVTLSLFFAVFATAYHVMSVDDPASFTEPLTRLDAAYFTVTVFATVGFGDIAATTETARAVTTTQMLGDLVLVGLVAHAVVEAVRTGMERQERRT